MPRAPRLDFEGAFHHVIARGTYPGHVFRVASDRDVLAGILDVVVPRYEWVCHAFCFLGNHYHLLLETPKAQLAAGMRDLNGTHAKRFNRRHERLGHVFRSRYRSVLVDSNEQFLGKLRYIALNPVRHGFCSHPGLWPWGSYLSTAGLVQPPPFLTIDWSLGLFGNPPALGRRRYREFIEAGLNPCRVTVLAA